MSFGTPKGSGPSASERRRQRHQELRADQTAALAASQRNDTAADNEALSTRERSLEKMRRRRGGRRGLQRYISDDQLEL